MSQEERTGYRDLVYSGWHRVDRLSRYLPRDLARLQTAIDIDWCEACGYCQEPVAFIETQMSAGDPKPATITVKVARKCALPAFSVSYVLTSDGLDIVAFRVQRREPYLPEVYAYTPEEYAQFLVRLRYDHYAASSDCGRSFSHLMGVAR